MKQPGRGLVLFLGAFLLAVQMVEVKAEESAAVLRLDLSAAVAQALKENPELAARRQAVGIAHGRVRQADLLFQKNPTLALEADYRRRRFDEPTGKSTADAEAILLQEIEIAGQRGHRRNAAGKDLARAKWVVAEAERLVRLEVTHAFYDLLGAQERVAIQKQLLSTQQALLDAGLERFKKEDISVLELDTLRLDKDQVQSDLTTKEQERIGAEKRLRLLLGLSGDTPLVARGDVRALATQHVGSRRLPHRDELTLCALQHRPDLRASQLQLEMREAEVRLARAKRIPNISLGPVYKLDDEDQVVGGTVIVPLPLFNRNQQELATALANRGLAQTTLQAQKRTIKVELASASARVHLAEKQLAAYGKAYVDDLAQSMTLLRRAYEAGEISVFELSRAQDRLVPARFRSLDAALAYLQAMAELDGQLAFQCIAPTVPEANGK